jgi:hypothetical protein
VALSVARASRVLASAACDCEIFRCATLHTASIVLKNCFGATPKPTRDKRALPFPEKFRRAMNFRWEAFVHGTIERGLLKDFAVRIIGPERDMNF